MVAICAQGLGFYYSERAPLFEQVTFRLVEGWCGLVGANGSGKSTLTRLIHGALRPTAGRLWLEPAGVGVVLCEQSVEQLTDEVQRFALSPDRDCCRWRGQLRLDPASTARWGTLSPGERKRWQLAAALAANTDVLIVDEPTNHLDGEARELVISALCRFTGIGLVVSHDRDLLAALTTRTLRIHGGAIELFAMSYAEAKVAWEQAAEHALDLRQEQVEKKRRLERRIAVANHDKLTAHVNRSAGHRMKNRHDHDASSIMADGRAANGEARISRSIGNMTAELERAKSAITKFIEDKTVCKTLFLDYQASAAPRIFGLDGEDLVVGDRTLMRDVRVTLSRTSRVHLKGPNGCGKSTLLAALLRKASANQRLLWLPQELHSDEVAELWRSVTTLPSTERGRLLSLLVALGVEPEHLLASRNLSPGEARKLKLAFGLATHAAALVLDEPTNHLDLPSIERLETALAAFPGAILLVSHDAQFAAAGTNSSWEIRDQRVYT
jgi:ATPase subunit of ABC transporter with duplicated ATPase domains